MATIDLVTKYLPYVDEIFTTESKKSLITNNDFTFDGAKTVKVYKISTVAMSDYDRTGKGSNASRYGELKDINATTETFTLNKDRSFTFAIDALDKDETGQQLEAAAALARQIREVVVPEVDSYTYNVMCTNAGTKKVDTALTETNIYNEIIEANKLLDDDEVPETGRHLIVTPAVYLLMKKCKDITMETDIGNDLRLKGVIANLDGLTVIKVPENRLPKGFGFMIAHPCATVAPTKLESYNTHVNPPGINGVLIEGRIAYDAFVLDNKKSAIYYLSQPAE